jgi:hypothetical protein
VVANEPGALEHPLELIANTSGVPMGMRTFYTAWHARLTGGSAVLPADEEAVSQLRENLEALAKLHATDEFEQLLPLLEQALPDERRRHLLLGGLYLKRQFADMAAEEYMLVAQTWGPDPETLTGLGKVATIKELWDDAQVFLEESLKLDPGQGDAQRLLELIRDRRTG